MAAYLIAQAKRHVQHCGGNTQIVTMMPSGSVIEIPPEVIYTHERSATLLLQNVANYLFFVTDPYANELNPGRTLRAIDFGFRKLQEELGNILRVQPPPAPSGSQQADDHYQDLRFRDRRP